MSSADHQAYEYVEPRKQLGQFHAIYTKLQSVQPIGQLVPQTVAYEDVWMPGDPQPHDGATIGVYTSRPLSSGRQYRCYVGAIIPSLRVFRWTTDSRAAFNAYMHGFSIPMDSWEQLLLQADQFDYLEFCLLDKRTTYRVRMAVAAALGRPNTNAGGEWWLILKGHTDVYGPGGKLEKASTVVSRSERSVDATR